MNVLLLGSGGREHALAWKLAQSPRLTTLWASRGNPGISAEIELINARRDRSDEIGTLGLCFNTDLSDHDSVVDFCRVYAIDLVVIGPEGPLVDGLTDALRAAEIAVFGPTAAAARLEGSKTFTKELCARENIPTAAYGHFASEADALAVLDAFGLPVVIKADGLAAGKGVVIAQTRAEAEAALADMFAGGFGGAGAAVVVEAFLPGEEVSFFAISDGGAIVPLGSAQDHKRVGEGDTGANTGGMGAYSPAAVFTPELEARALAEIVEPTIRAMAAAGTPYRGVLYAGLMLTPEGPQLIEYNVRFGDPEAQVLMMRLEDDLLDLLLAAAEGRLAERAPPRLAEHAALTVVMAANGYPGTPQAGGAIAGIEAAEATGARVFHAGTRRAGDGLVAAGGRVLSVTATGADVAAAQAAAYRAVDAIDFPTGFCRRDIGWREVEREKGR